MTNGKKKLPLRIPATQSEEAFYAYLLERNHLPGFSNDWKTEHSGETSVFKFADELSGKTLQITVTENSITTNIIPQIHFLLLMRHMPFLPPFESWRASRFEAGGIFSHSGTEFTIYRDGLIYMNNFNPLDIPGYFVKYLTFNNLLGAESPHWKYFLVNGTPVLIDAFLAQPGLLETHYSIYENGIISALPSTPKLL